MGLPCSSDSKEYACNSGDPGSIPGSGRSPGEGNDNPLQYSCLEDPMDRGTWWATVRGVSKSQTQMSDKQGEVQIVNYWGGSWGLAGREHPCVFSAVCCGIYSHHGHFQASKTGVSCGAGKRCMSWPASPLLIICYSAVTLWIPVHACVVPS